MPATAGPESPSASLLRGEVSRVWDGSSPGVGGAARGERRALARRLLLSPVNTETKGMDMARAFEPEELADRIFGITLFYVGIVVFASILFPRL